VGVFVCVDDTAIAHQPAQVQVHFLLQFNNAQCARGLWIENSFVAAPCWLGFIVR
jgi:hypothetical protein